MTEETKGQGDMRGVGTAEAGAAQPLDHIILNRCETGEQYQRPEPWVDRR